jgi:hypothetical protein
VVASLFTSGLLGGLGASLVLAVPCIGGRLDRRRWPFVVTGGVLAAVCALLVVYAAGDDTYFSSGSVTRWDFASRSGSQGFVGGAFVLGVATLALMVAAAAKPSSRWWRRCSMGAAALTFFGFMVAWFVLTVGH